MMRSLLLFIAVLAAGVATATPQKPLVMVGSKAFTESVILGDVAANIV